MELGAFSVSLAVKDLAVSIEFYKHLGFEPFHGNPEQGWSVMKNGDHVIGLFQGMFDKNILTFNPGWDQAGGDLDSFTDIRDMQRELKKHGVELISEADEATTGPASMMLADPDGNQILIDQHR